VAPTAAGERLLARLRPLLDDFDAVLDSNLSLVTGRGRGAAPSSQDEFPP
jgi:DNA-binding transcriptional LysR family regulator